jgi:hypothetical protein
MVGTPTSQRAVYYFTDYKEREYQGRRRITRQHVTVPETVPTKYIPNIYIYIYLSLPLTHHVCCLYMIRAIASSVNKCMCMHVFSKLAYIHKSKELYTSLINLSGGPYYIHDTRGRTVLSNQVT